MYERCLDAAGRHAQPNVGLDALVSAFSTGPVAIGDGNGQTNAALALATCRADGVLLIPVMPLTPIDRMWWSAAASAGAGMANAAREHGAQAAATEAVASPSWLMQSYSRIGDGLWRYVVAIDAPCNTTPPVRLNYDLWWPPHEPAYAAAEYAAAWHGAACAHGEPAYTRSSCVARLDAHNGELAACTVPGHRFPNGTHVWALATLAPLLPGGWALLGEPDKFVGVSHRRFARVDGRDRDVLTLELEGMVSEAVHLVIVTPRPDARVLVLHATIGAAGWLVCNASARSTTLACA